MMKDTDEFLGAIETESSNRSWTIPLLLNDVSVYFKTDTGADVTVILGTVFKQLESTVLKPSLLLKWPLLGQPQNLWPISRNSET